MNPEIVSPNNIDSDETNYTNGEAVEQPALIEGNDTETKLLPPQKLPIEPTGTPESYNAQWQTYGEKIGTFLQNLPSYIARFFAENKEPLGVIGLILATLITVKLTLALLDAINSIPLIAPTLEIIGLAYSAWFTYRYLLRASNRQELYRDYQSLKEQVLGTKS